MAETTVLYNDEQDAGIEHPLWLFLNVLSGDGYRQPAPAPRTAGRIAPAHLNREEVVALASVRYASSADARTRPLLRQLVSPNFATRSPHLVT